MIYYIVLVILYILHSKTYLILYYIVFYIPPPDIRVCVFFSLLLFRLSLSVSLSVSEAHYRGQLTKYLCSLWQLAQLSADCTVKRKDLEKHHLLVQQRVSLPATPLSSISVLSSLHYCPPLALALVWTCV